MDLYVWTVLLVPMTKYPCDAAGEGCASEPVTDDLAELELCRGLQARAQHCQQAYGLGGEERLSRPLFQ